MAFIIDDILNIGGAINGIIQGNKANKAAIELKQKEQQFQQDIASLTNEQQYILQTQLNGAKNETERYAILTNAVTQLRLKQQDNSTTGNNANMMFIIGVIVLALITLVVIRKI